MTAVQTSTEHSFHVPVMGIGFTVDSAIRLAPLGIDSCISLVNDGVIEAARAHHSRLHLLPYQEITAKEEDSRARRITAYLNLVDLLIEREVARVRASSFDEEGGIRRYFELLPGDSPLRVRFDRAIALPPGQERDDELYALRAHYVPGSTGVNIMTKLDGPKDAKGEPHAKGNTDALSALRGFALSSLDGPLVLSAGANPGLFAYLSEFDDFFPDAHGRTLKTIILKVSDFRSAHVQGRMLARRGIWISEHRLESGLNCGGHAFPTEGLLMGPILEEFKAKRSELREGLFATYKKGLAARGIDAGDAPPAVKITAQGGVGTHEEHQFLLEHYGLDGVGWGSPFLMVEEAVSLDARTRANLTDVKKEDVGLTWSSPLGVRFWWLKTCDSEVARQERNEAGLSGSVCTGRHLALNEDYGKVPLCTGSRAYQKRRRAELDPNAPDYSLQVERLEAPACICLDLCGSFLETVAEKEAPPPAICPGPNIVNFARPLSLEEMVDHIYGRANVLTREDRVHVFHREIELYLEVLEEDLKLLRTSLESRNEKQLVRTMNTLREGLEYYRVLFSEGSFQDSDTLVKALAPYLAQLEKLEARFYKQVEAPAVVEAIAAAP